VIHRTLSLSGLQILLGLLASPAAAQRTEVGRTLTEALAHQAGFRTSGYLLADLRLGNDSTDVVLGGFVSGDPEDGEFRAGARAVGYFELPFPTGQTSVQDLFGEARVIGVAGDSELGIDWGILTNTAAHFVYDGWGLVASVEVGALARADVRSFSTGLQGVVWQQVGELVGSASYRVVRFPLRIPDPSYFQAAGKVYYHDVGLELHRDGATEVGLRVGHRFAVPGGTWAILEVGRALGDDLALVVTGGRSAGAPELSAPWETFVSVGLEWRPNYGGWAPTR